MRREARKQNRHGTDNPHDFFTILGAKFSGAESPMKKIIAINLVIALVLLLVIEAAGQIY